MVSFTCLIGSSKLFESVSLVIEFGSVSLECELEATGTDSFFSKLTLIVVDGSDEEGLKVILMVSFDAVTTLSSILSLIVGEQVEVLVLTLVFW